MSEKTVIFVVVKETIEKINKKSEKIFGYFIFFLYNCIVKKKLSLTNKK